MAEYSEIELRPDSVVTPLGDCKYNIDGRTIEFKIRKLTVRECMRLMDVPENVVDKILQKDENGKQIISNSQGYKPHPKCRKAQPAHVPFPCWLP